MTTLPATAAAHRPEIDSLRALAMTAVIAMHCRLLPMGWTGVWLFFVISGYVVTLSILRHHDEQVPGSGLRRFFTQRAARILPPYYAYLGVGLVLCLLLGQRLDPVPWLSLVFFGHNVAMDMSRGEIATWHVGHLWTLSVEMQFYLVYGLLAHFLSLRNLRRLLFAFLVLAPLARAGVSYALRHANPEVTSYIIYSAPGLHFDSFAIGCLLAMAGREEITPRKVRWISIIAGAALVYYLAIYAEINVLVRHDHGLAMFHDLISGVPLGQGREVLLYSTLAAVFLALLMQTLIGAAWLRPLATSRSAQWIGRVSYGGYIYHPLGIMVAATLMFGRPITDLGTPQRVAVFCLAYLLTLVLAGVSSRWLEQPAARAITQTLDRLPPLSVAGPVMRFLGRQGLKSARTQP